MKIRADYSDIAEPSSVAADRLGRVDPSDEKRPSLRLRTAPDQSRTAPDRSGTAT